METRANYIAIGIFTLLVFTMAFGFIYWLVRFNETGEARFVELIIPGNAGGLKRGNGVLFNGLRIGSVVSVKLSQADPQNVFATLKIDASAPIREDTQVTIESQPLTGLANVALVGGSADKDLLLQRDEIPPLLAKQSSLNETLEAAADTVRIATKVLTQVEKMVEKNGDAINTTIENVEAFSTALASNSGDISQLLENVGRASVAVGKLSETLDGVSGNVNAIMTAVDPAKIEKTLSNVEKISTDLAQSSGQVEGVIEETTKIVSSFSGIATSLSATVAAIDSEQINRTISNVEGFSGDLRETLKKVDGISSDVEAIVKVVDPEKIGSTLANVEKISGDFARNSGEFDGIMNDAKKAVGDISGVAESLNKTARAIDGDQLARTLTNVEGFSGDLRETLKKVDNVVGALDGARINKTIASLEGFASRLDAAGSEIDTIIANASSATGDVAKFTKNLAKNQEAIDQVISDATIISNRLIKTSEAVTKLVGRVDGLVEGDGQGFIVEVTDAARAIRKVAESFESRANAISGGLARFSTRGLGEIEALIGQSRQAVTRIESVISNLERNPSQFLLGSQKVPEYRRQRR